MVERSLHPPDDTDDAEAPEAGDRVTDPELEAAIFGLLATRRDGATICPSEVARALAPEDGRWRKLMPQIRQVAQRLARDHRLSVTRGGVSVDAMSGGGPVRLGRGDGGGGD